MYDNYHLELHSVGTRAFSVWSSLTLHTFSTNVLRHLLESDMTLAKYSGKNAVATVAGRFSVFSAVSNFAKPSQNCFKCSHLLTHGYQNEHDSRLDWRHRDDYVNIFGENCPMSFFYTFKKIRGPLVL